MGPAAAGRQASTGSPGGRGSARYHNQSERICDRRGGPGFRASWRERTPTAGNPVPRDRLPPTISAAQVQQIRSAAREAVELSSLRTVAPAIGIGHSTLHNFLCGANPNPRVRRILYDWFVHGWGGAESQCLDTLTRELAADVRNRLRPALAQLLASGYVESSLGVPAWLLAATEGASVTIPAPDDGGRRDYHGSPHGPAGGATRVHALHGGDVLPPPCGGSAGVSRSTVHNFITAGTTPQPRCRRLLALWYLRRLKGVDELELIRPYVSALDVLLADVPAASLRNVTLTLLRGITEGFSAEDEEAPRWLDVVRRRRVGWVLGDNDERLNALEEESVPPACEPIRQGTTMRGHPVTRDALSGGGSSAGPEPVAPEQLGRARERMRTLGPRALWRRVGGRCLRWDRAGYGPRAGRIPQPAAGVLAIGHAGTAAHDGRAVFYRVFGARHR